MSLLPAYGLADLEVHFLDVGQADAILILSDDDAMLIDGGNSADSDFIYSYLRRHDVERLDYIVNTHPHEDHVGGLSGALNYATAGTAYGSMLEYDSKAFNNFIKYLDKQDVELEQLEVGHTIELGDAKVECLAPLSESENVNDMSLVLKLVYGGTSFLFMGDAERDEEQDLLNAGYDLNATVLKVGHHGSETSTSYPFLREVMPEYAVISVGEGNSYGHPTDAVLSRLRDADVKTYRTDIHGTVIFRSDGDSVSVDVEQNTNRSAYESVGSNSLAGAIIGSALSWFLSSDESETPTVKPAEASTTVAIDGGSEKEAETEEDEADSRGSGSYVLNTSTKKFHRASCSSVKRMKDKNKAYGSIRAEIIADGYSPCKKCNP